MKSLNKTILFRIFILIKIIVGVFCPTDEDLQRCQDELYAEFQNEEPFDDFLHAFLHIKHVNVFWDANTNINEQIYRGNEILERSARGYYDELLSIALEIGLPELPSPQDFCRTHHRIEEHDCLSAIEAKGCPTDYTGAACFERMYQIWRESTETDNALPGTEDLSAEELLEAIYKGSDRFRGLCDQDLFEAFTRSSDVIESLSDEIILRARYKRLYDRRIRYFGGGSSNDDEQRDDDDFYGRNEFNEFLRLYCNAEERQLFISDLNYRIMFDERNICKAREQIFGVPNASYAVICEEYQRRKNLPKFFDNLYAKEIYDALKSSSWDISNFISRADFCEKYLSDE